MSTKTPGSRDNRRTKPKLRHESGPGMKLTDFALLSIFVTSLVLVPLALFAMSEERGPVTSLKYLLVGFAAAGAAYGVNKFAVDRLAPLHAIGYNTAGALAVVAILTTGLGTAIASFTGIAFKAIEIKIYQEAGKDLADFIAQTNELTLTMERVVPSVEAVAGSIVATLNCEVQSSCLSEQGNGGRGSMARNLEGRAAQAFSIVEALDEGTRDRVRLLERLNDHSADYNMVLADQRRPVAERRTDLQAIYAEVRQNASALVETIPMSLLQGYVGQLQQGATLPGNPDGTRRLSEFLRAHGDTLEELLSDLPDTALAAPVFPDRPGMIEVLRYLPVYLAIAAIVIVGELVLPITLYFLTYFRLAWEIERREDEPTPKPDDDGFGGLLDPTPRDDPEDRGAKP